MNPSSSQSTPPELVSEGPRLRAPHRAGRLEAWSLGLLVIGLVSVVGVRAHTRLDRELLDMPESERRALLERTTETLLGACMHTKGPVLSAYCRDQAKFLEHIPECDTACRELAAHFTPYPSR